MCFAALGCAIRSFTTHMRPIIIIDAAHLKGTYLGTTFLAVGMDANNQIVPIGFGVGKSEGLVFVSDRAASIHQAINTVYPGAHHALCCRHLMKNEKTRDSRVRYRKKLFWRTCKTYTVEEFELNMTSLRAALPLGAPLMDHVGPEKWSRAHFPGLRYNIMISNSAESVNALSRFARKMPIVSLMDYFRCFQQEWYSIRRRNGEEMVNRLTPWAEANIEKRIHKSATWTVHEIDRGYWEVRDGFRDAEVTSIIDFARVGNGSSQEYHAAMQSPSQEINGVHMSPIWRLVTTRRIIYDKLT
ncbi:hypothetical protein L6452_39330 [Arctium lappa]|uniref:Uncharacterized protein n=1 Tax=Arctium lappa TaxID=4217 RepID=A0ACB8XS85_ARCLA|nr:hypothetical protein L6452_39330 [Arctium lappa]